MSTNPYADILETMGAVGAEKAREGTPKFLLAELRRKRRELPCAPI